MNSKELRKYKAKLKKKIERVELAFNLEQNEDKRENLVEELGSLINEYRKL